METMTVKKVVTAFIRHGGRILLLRRSRKVGSYRGKWAGVSGYLEQNEPLVQALTEIREETGLSETDVVLVKAGTPLEVADHGLGVCWIVYPFLFETETPAKIQLDWEHVDMQWAAPDELGRLDTVPRLAEAYMQCRVDPA